MKKLIVIIPIFFLIACFSQTQNPGRKLQVPVEGTVPVISGSSVIQGPYTLYIEESGLFGLLYNSDIPLFKEAGPEFFYNGRTQQFADFTAKKQIINKDAIINLGVLPAASGDFVQQIQVAGKKIVFTYTFPREFAAAFPYFNVALHFPRKNMMQAAYTADGHYAQFPGSFSAMILAEKIINLKLDFAGITMQFESDQAFALCDGRAWKSDVFSIVFDLKQAKSPLEFRLTLPQDTAVPVLEKEHNLRYSRLGYAVTGPKIAFLETPAGVPVDVNEPVTVVDEAGRAVMKGQFGSGFTAYQFYYRRFDFSTLTRTGRYKLIWAEGESDYFSISNAIFDNIWQDALDNYLPFQMCHITLNHTNTLINRPACHLDDAICVPEGTAEVDGFFAYPQTGQKLAEGQYIPSGVGGWHDAGDYDLNTAAQGLTVHHLALAYEEFAIMHDTATLELETQSLTAGAPDGIPDILQQVAWGALWLLAMQHPDGHFYAGVIEQAALYKPDIPPGKTSDGLLTNGDERYVYPGYQSAEHLKAVVGLAAAARVLNVHFPALSARCLKAAQSGYAYFENHDEVYNRQTSFLTEELFPSSRDQTVMAAAAELFLTTNDSRYMDMVEHTAPGLGAARFVYPEPDQTNRMNYIFAAPFLARIYSLLKEGEAKSRIKTFLRESIARKKYLRGFANWPYRILLNPWYGQNGFPLRLVFDFYYLAKAFPDEVDTRDGLACLYWLLGLHPLNAQVYITGLHSDQPQRMYSGILTAAYGDEPHTIPGAVIPGLCTMAGRITFLDDYHEFRFSEPIVDVSATLIFAAHALISTLAEAAPAG